MCVLLRLRTKCTLSPLLFLMVSPDLPKSAFHPERSWLFWCTAQPGAGKRHFPHLNIVAWDSEITTHAPTIAGTIRSPPAIHRQNLPVHEPRQVRGEEDHRVGDVLGRAEVLHG